MSLSLHRRSSHWSCKLYFTRYLTSWFPIQQFSCIIHYDDFTANEESSLWNTSSRYNVEIHAFQITLEEDDSKTQAGVHIACSQKGSHLSESGTISQVCFSFNVLVKQFCVLHYKLVIARSCWMQYSSSSSVPMLILQ